VTSHNDVCKIYHICIFVRHINLKMKKRTIKPIFSRVSRRLLHGEHYVWDISTASVQITQEWKYIEKYLNQLKSIEPCIYFENMDVGRISLCTVITNNSLKLPGFYSFHFDWNISRLVSPLFFPFHILDREIFQTISSNTLEMNKPRRWNTNDNSNQYIFIHWRMTALQWFGCLATIGLNYWYASEN